MDIKYNGNVKHLPTEAVGVYTALLWSGVLEIIQKHIKVLPDVVYLYQQKYTVVLYFYTGGLISPFTSLVIEIDNGS